MLGITLENIKVGKSNCGGKCLLCKTRDVFYSILNGKFVYFCLNCNKWIDRYDVK